MRIPAVAALLALASCAHQPFPASEVPAGLPLPGPVYAIPIDGAPTTGATAPHVTIVAFLDLGADESREAGRLLREATNAMPAELRLSVRLVGHARESLFVLAAGHQGKFWEAFDRVSAVKGELDGQGALAIAKELGIDLQAVESAQGAIAGHAKASADAAKRFGVEDAPTIFLNGRRFIGELAPGSLRASIDAERRSARELMAQGLRPEFVAAALTRNALTEAPRKEVEEARPMPRPQPAPPRPTPPSDSGPFKVELGDAAIIGPALAKVTIVEFTEYQCPFCARVEPTLKQIRAEYGDDVRFVVKHNPLPFHADAPLAAEAAVEAQAQGKFEPFHRRLFANQSLLKRDDLLAHAEAVGMDARALDLALEAGTHRARVDGDKAQAAELGARGTPTFFINGMKLRGAQPFAAFKTIIDEQLAKANEQLASGVPLASLYESLQPEKNPELPPPPRPVPSRPPEPPPGRTAFDVSDLGQAPVRGPADAKVTIVVWSDFQCPFCARAVPTMERLLKAYPKDVRLVFRHQPLPFHQQAMPAAIASMAAHQQGKFWAFHDQAFANQRDLTEENFVKWAKALGLNVAKFEKALSDEAIEAQVEADSEAGSEVGADGTPTFFVNGRQITGSQAYELFEKVVKEEIAHADALGKKGLPKGTTLYEALVKDNVETMGEPRRQAAADDEEAPDAPVKIELGDAPVRGPAKAPVTVVVWSDFQCPFCRRVVPTIEALQKKFPKEVRFAFKHQPLPFHDRAEPAARASIAAQKQGKFWAFHDRLFENQTDLSDEALRSHAQAVKLDLKRFDADFAAPATAERVRAEMAEGAALGANGTPTFFVDGRMLVGAQPLESFEDAVREALDDKK